MQQCLLNSIMNKDSLRKIYKKKRNELYVNGSILEISDLISQKIIANDFFKAAQNILLFYPKDSELNILGIIDSQFSKDKKFYLPVCCNEEINICPYIKGDKLILNKYKIYEPETKPLKDLKQLDIIITPALCAEKSFNRIGYGKGYYDRLFTKKNLNAKKIIVIPDEFLLESIPHNEFDMPCDYIVTEKRVLKSPVI